MFISSPGSLTFQKTSLTFIIMNSSATTTSTVTITCKIYSWRPQTITNLGATLCFVTTIPIHAGTWNHHCFHSNYASNLLHNKDHDSMQESFKNHRRHQPTLRRLQVTTQHEHTRFAPVIFYKPSSKDKHTDSGTTYYPIESTQTYITQKWAEILHKSMSINRIRQSEGMLTSNMSPFHRHSIISYSNAFPFVTKQKQNTR